MASPFEVTIRPATAQDVDRLVDIWREAVLATHMGFLSKEHFREIEDIVQRVYLPQNVHMFYVAEIAEKVVPSGDEEPNNAVVAGFIGWTANRVDALFVHPEFFGKRVGTRLLNAVAKTIRSENGQTEKSCVLQLDCNEGNTTAQNFYKSRGFRVVGRSEEDDDGRPYPMLHMELAL